MIKELISQEKDMMSKGQRLVGEDRKFIDKYKLDLSGFADYKINFKWMNFNVGNKGCYDSNHHTLQLDRCYSQKGKNCGRDIYYVLMHEVQHAFQGYLIENQDSLLKQIDDPEIKEEFKSDIYFLKMCRGEEFEISYITPSEEQSFLRVNLYIQTNDTFDNTIKTLSEMFYKLNLMKKMHCFHT